MLQASKSRNESSTEGEFGSLFVSVDGIDVTGLVVRLSRGSTVRGRITLDGVSEPPLWSLLDLTALPVDVDRSPLVGSPSASARVREDWTFEMAGVNGPRVFRLAFVPPGWTLGAVRRNGIEVTDTPIDFGRADQSLSGLEVVLTDRVSAISGRVVDARGREAADCTVVIFGPGQEPVGPGLAVSGGTPTGSERRL